MSGLPRKLIEVALPLEEINDACKADKDRKTGTLRNLHKWFAPMPLPAWRALIYAALIDDPGDDEARAKHLEVIKRLVSSGADIPTTEVLLEAERNLSIQFPEGVPLVMDPFCGGGSTLVEAQRLGLPTFGSDFNPVPVLITRTLTEILPKVYGFQPLHPILNEGERLGGTSGLQQELLSRETSAPTFAGYEGVVADVNFYAREVRAAAWDRLSHLYPANPGETTAAWIWARTAQCSNPTCGAETVLTTSWWLSKKTGDLAWVEPKVDGREIHLEVISGQKEGRAPEPPKVGRGASFLCLVCGQVLEEETLRTFAQSQGLGRRMIAVVAESNGKRLYRSVSQSDLAPLVGLDAGDARPDLSVGPASQYCAPPRYGLTTFGDLFLDRQILTLSVLSEVIREVPNRVKADGGSDEWSNAVVTVLTLVLGKMAQYGSTQSMITTPSSGPTRFNSLFARSDLPMTWDFFEQNFFGTTGGNWDQAVTTATRALSLLPGTATGEVVKADARTVTAPRKGLVATDPPYFDAIPYADLSDYFYIWHRSVLKDVWPDLYATAAVPKVGELTAFAGKHGSKEAAKDYFIQGFTETFRNLEASMREDFPMVLVYASKEQKGGLEEETRWASILSAIVAAGLQITSTWPIHGTGSSRMRGIGANAVATYVAMTCRPRLDSAGNCSLQDFNRALRRELKLAVHALQAAGILPVDLAQAAMGPGMQVYSRYQAVLDQSGKPVPVDLALRMINQALSEVLDEQEGDLDPDSRFAVTWWEKHHWSEASFGEADQLARPKGISVDDVVRAGVAIYPRPGFVQVVGGDELNRTWTPTSDARPTAWEAVHHLADRLIDGGGISEAGALMSQLGFLRDQAQGLVYRLHAIAARRGWTKDQERYNALIGSWSDLLAEAGRSHASGDGLF